MAEALAKGRLKFLPLFPLQIIFIHSLITKSQEKIRIHFYGFIRSDIKSHLNMRVDSVGFLLHRPSDAYTVVGNKCNVIEAWEFYNTTNYRAFFVAK